MTLSSMTGFARASGEWRGLVWVWELKSVNGRNLDIRCRLPQGFDALELTVRRKLSESLTRGSVTASLTVRGQTGDTVIRINEDILGQLIGLAQSMGKKVHGIEAARLDGLLNVPGVVSIDEAQLSDDDLAKREAALLTSLDKAIASLVTMRQGEGARLQSIGAELIQLIARLTQRARDCPAAQVAAIRRKFEIKVAEFAGNLAGVDAGRLAQEAALLATKADIREELDRLDAHVRAASDLLDSAAAGRRLDFLAQEFNREANTLCSKSSDAELTGIGLELKAAIDQFREQVQNIE